MAPSGRDARRHDRYNHTGLNPDRDGKAVIANPTVTPFWLKATCTH